MQEPCILDRNGRLTGPTVKTNADLIGSERIVVPIEDPFLGELLFTAIDLDRFRSKFTVHVQLERVNGFGAQVYRDDGMAFDYWILLGSVSWVRINLQPVQERNQLGKI